MKNITPETYADELRDPRWIARREEIKARDGGKCILCEDTKHLQVHHIRYTKGAKAWEYPDSNLVTLCEHHHDAIHNPTERLQAENMLIAAIRRAGMNTLEVMELIPVLLQVRTKWRETIDARNERLSQP